MRVRCRLADALSYSDTCVWLAINPYTEVRLRVESGLHQILKANGRSWAVSGIESGSYSGSRYYCNRLGAELLPGPAESSLETLQ